MNLSEIQQAVRQLSKQDLSRIRAWFDEFDAQKWDEQIERDALSKKLDKLADEAIHQEFMWVHERFAGEY